MNDNPYPESTNPNHSTDARRRVLDAIETSDISLRGLMDIFSEAILKKGARFAYDHLEDSDLTDLSDRMSDILEMFYGTETAASFERAFDERVMELTLEEASRPDDETE